MYECFHCGARSVIWDADFSFEDYGLEGEGIVHHCHCTECGAEIDYYVSCDPIEEEGETMTEKDKEINDLRRENEWLKSELKAAREAQKLLFDLVPPEKLINAVVTPMANNKEHCD